MDFKSKYGEEVLFIFPARILGGHELMAMEIIKDYLSVGGKCKVALDFNNKKLLDLAKNYNLEVIQLPFTTPRLEFIHFLLNIYKINLSQEFLNKYSTQFNSIILVQGDIEIGAIYVKAAKKQKIELISYLPYAHTARKMNKKLFFLRDIVNPFIFKNVNKYITIYNKCESELKKYNKNAEVDIIRNKTRNLDNVRRLRNEFTFDEKYRIYLVGRILFSQKGHDNFVESLSYIQNSIDKKIEVNFIGDGNDLEKLKQMCLLKLPNIKTNFHGWMEEPWLEAYKADLIVIPSNFEGVPLIMLEAISLGVDILASAVDGMVDYLDNESLIYSKKEFNEKLLDKINNN